MVLAIVLIACKKNDLSIQSSQSLSSASPGKNGSNGGPSVSNTYF